MKKITLLFAILLFAITANVSAQTQLTAPAVGTATLPTTVGFTANWTAVANASSYIVNVYDSSPALAVSVPVAGATTATAVITGLSQGTAYTYTVIAVGDGTIYTNSAESTPSAAVTTLTLLTTPAVGTASRLTLTGFTANWTAVANAASYSVNVYDGLGALVTGSPKTVTGATSATLAIAAMLSPGTTYTYTVTAIGDGTIYASSVASANSASFITATSTGTFTLQYADVDVATLNADLKGGAADIYELTTSGGAYTFVTTASNNNTLIRNTTIKAASGLAAKPIVKLNSTTTGSTANIFNTASLGLTLKFDGLEFDGINTGGTGQPLAIYDSNTGVTNTKIYITHCYFHDFKNASGNGVIRMNGVSSTQVLDIQSSNFNTCSGRILYINGASATTINLKNNTFCNSTTLSSRHNVIYNSAANTGTTTIDHCTFYKVGDATVTNGVVRTTGSTNGAITIKNSIFVTVPTTLPTGTVDYCYLAGLTTVPTGATNTFAAATVPAFTNATTLDFSLTNKSSFVCGDALIAGNTSYYPVLPKLDTPVVGSASNIGTNGFTANWSTVPNAIGYNVAVYQGSTLISTTKATGQATTSLAIIGLQTATTYTFKVAALGDAMNYDISFESSASPDFTTLGLPAPIVSIGSNITKSGFTANWTPTANATGYEVMTYLTTSLVKTTNVTGQTTSNIAISGLAMGTTYTYKVVAVGDGVTYLNSDPSSPSGIVKTVADTLKQINPNFADSSWGTVYPNSLTLGSFPTFSANGYDLTKAYVQTISVKGLKGEEYTHVLKLDKTTNAGVLDFPVVASVSQFEIHASATTGRSFTLYIWNAGTSTYDTYGTYPTTIDTEEIFLINFATPLTNAKFRITNPSSGAFTFYKLITRTSQPVKLATPTVGAASAVEATSFTANWTPVDANASNYEVKVYKGTTLKLTATTTGEQATSSLVVTGLQADSTYTYKVKALGDEVNYLDSYQTVASASFTTGHQLATPVVGTPTAIVFGIVTNWSTVANATGYIVKVYQGTSLVQTQTVTDPNATSLAVNGLLSENEYTFTVTAKGDGVTYFDSSESANSVAIKTLPTGLNQTKNDISLKISGNEINCSEMGNIELFNVQGAKVLEAKYITKLSVNLNSGLYIVRLTALDGKTISSKMIIK